jgi:hypothetical protein
MNTIRPAAKSIGLYPTSARGRNATQRRIPDRSTGHRVSTTPVSSDPRTSAHLDGAGDGRWHTAPLAIRAIMVRPACVPTSAFSAPRKQRAGPTSDQSATPSERRI